MNWKKVAISAAAAAIVFGILELAAALVSPHVVYAAFALTAAGLAWRLAPWEVTRATGGLVK